MIRRLASVTLLVLAAGLAVLGGGAKPTPPECAKYWTQIGGDCKGNVWCECRLTVRQVTEHPKVGKEVTVEFKNDNLGQEYDAGNDTFRRRIALKGSVNWGDGEPPSDLDTGSHKLTHVYRKPGTYKISAEIHGDFKWNNPGEGASCSYRDRTAPAALDIQVAK
jgi:hypothetical protein